jgi:DNA-binding FadR family transcriptional regulator
MATVGGPSAPSHVGSHPAVTRVSGRVESLIATGRLRPGDRLAPKRKLALHVGVSRPTIRTGLPSAMSDEVAALFASVEAPRGLLLHDVRFHRSFAAASGNPVLGALVELVSALVYDRRRLTVERAKDLEESAEMPRRIYGAIRQKDSAGAR